jgi:two-component system, OmpR family, response regulator AdeR
MNTATHLSKLVLVVEDEPNLSQVLEAYLQRDGFRTERAADGENALRLFHEARPDLVLLDVMLPKLDGFEVLRQVRQAGSTPVIMVTARVEDVDRLVGLRMGADDYVMKPFNPPEVVERVKAVLRRVQPVTAEKPLCVAGLELDPRGMQITALGTRLELTLSEYRLLELLVQHPGRVFSRAELLERCLPESGALERVVDAHLGSVRRKLAAVGLAHPLESVRGVGYRLVDRLVDGSAPE